MREYRPRARQYRQRNIASQIQDHCCRSADVSHDNLIESLQSHTLGTGLLPVAVDGEGHGGQGWQAAQSKVGPRVLANEQLLERREVHNAKLRVQDLKAT
jgi:hypothetical protein